MAPLPCRTISGSTRLQVRKNPFRQGHDAVPAYLIDGLRTAGIGDTDVVLKDIDASMTADSIADGLKRCDVGAQGLGLAALALDDSVGTLGRCEVAVDNRPL